MYIYNVIWLVVQPLWKIMEFVSWAYDIPNWMESHKNVPNHQSDMYICTEYLINMADVNFDSLNSPRSEIEDFPKPLSDISCWKIPVPGSVLWRKYHPSTAFWHIEIIGSNCRITRIPRKKQLIHTNQATVESPEFH